MTMTKIPSRETYGTLVVMVISKKLFFTLPELVEFCQDSSERERDPRVWQNKVQPFSRDSRRCARIP